MRAVRVIVVEDNDLNRLLFYDLLELAGFEVVDAEDAGAARDLLARFVPDIIVTDVQIPGGGAEQLLQHVRSQPGLRNVPVVAVTARAMDGDREELLSLGFDGYLSKPIDTKSFAENIRAFVPARREASHGR